MNEYITEKRKRTIPARLYGNPVRILEYALTAPIEQVEELADAMIETQDAEYIKEFLLYVDGAPIEKLFAGLIKTNNIEIIVNCYDYLKNKMSSNELGKIIPIEFCNILYENLSKEEIRVEQLRRDLESKNDIYKALEIAKYISSLLELEIVLKKRVMADVVLRALEVMESLWLLATKSIRKPKINATQEQPKRYVRTKR